MARTKKTLPKKEDLLTDVVEDIGSSREVEHKARKARIYMRLARLADKAVDELERTLAEGGGRERLEAAKIILKSQGVDVAPQDSNDTTLTVVLPSGVQVSSSTKPTVLEVKNEQE